jgi:hypothetical protein
VRKRSSSPPLWPLLAFVLTLLAFLLLAVVFGDGPAVAV